MNVITAFPDIHFLFFCFHMETQDGGGQEMNQQYSISNTDGNFQSYCRIWCSCLDMRSLFWLDLIPFSIWMHILHQSEARRANKFVCRGRFHQSGCWLYTRTYLVLDITKVLLYDAKEKEVLFCNWQEPEPVENVKDSACLFQSLYVLIPWLLVTAQGIPPHVKCRYKLLVSKHCLRHEGLCFLQRRYKIQSSACDTV